MKGRSLIPVMCDEAMQDDDLMEEVLSPPWLRSTIILLTLAILLNTALDISSWLGFEDEDLGWALPMFTASTLMAEKVKYSIR